MKLSPRQIIDQIGLPEAVRITGMSRTAIIYWRNQDKVPKWQEGNLQSLAQHLPSKRRKQKGAKA